MDKTDVKYEVTVELPKGISIPSVNAHKEPRLGKWGKIYMYKNPKVCIYQEELKNKLDSSCLTKLRGITPKPKAIKATFKFHFRKRFWRRDISNLIKATEDVVKDIVEIDDSRTVHITGEKIKIKDDNEFVTIILEVVSEDYTG